MKKAFILWLVVLGFFTARAQAYRYYLDNTLVFKNPQGQGIPFPFMGGLVAPQFSNTDFDGDGVKDLFVFDRGNNKVLTFLHPGNPNSEDWIYAPQYEVLFPKLYQWALLVDYNGDGREDLFTAAYPFYYPHAIRVFKNVLQPNGLPGFELVKEVVVSHPNPPDPYIIPSLVLIDLDIPALEDIDGDGDMDILAAASSASTVNLYRNERVEKGYSADSLVFTTVDQCWGSFSETYFQRYIQLNAPCFFGREYSKGPGHPGTTLLLLDMDNDGDKDLLYGDADYSELIFLTNGKKNYSWPYDTITAYDSVFPRNTTQAKVLFLPGAYYVDVNNNGIKDLIVAPNTNLGGKTLQQVYYYRNTGLNTLPGFTFVKNTFLQELTVDFGSGAALAFFDVDADGDLDLMVSNLGDFEKTVNTASRFSLFKNTGTKLNPEFQLENNLDYLGLLKDSIKGIKPTFGDLDGDGHPDMLAGDAYGRIHFYKNTGSQQLTLAAPVKNYMNIAVGFKAAPQLIDLDKDGLLDIVLGNERGEIHFYKNKGTVTQPLFDNTPTIERLGNVNINIPRLRYIYDRNTGALIDSVWEHEEKGDAAPFFTDLNEDGKLELLVGGLEGKLRLFTDIEGNLAGTFTEITDFVYDQFRETFGGIHFGGDIVPVAVKLSDTMPPAIFTGNARGGINYLRPGSGKVTSIRPASREAVAQITIYPNPAKETITIARTTAAENEELIVEITDALGRTIYNGIIEKDRGNITITLTALPGVYYVTCLTAKGNRNTGKLILIE